MGRFRSSGPWLAIAILSLLGLPACGGGSKAGPPLFPGKITLTPGTPTSLQLGTMLIFTTAVQTASGTNLTTTITYTSSDTSILNVSPTGVACAGHWDNAFTTCTPGATGVVQVTANALGGSSTPAYIFVHPPIDNVTVTGILINGVPVQEPCLSQGQSMTLEAHAYSQGTDITGTVGPFTWSANNATVVTINPLSNTSINPITNTTYNFATNRATATAAVPGISYIFASSNGATSTSFQQPTLNNAAGESSPPLDFFATCPIQNIALEMSNPGSGQTSFSDVKGGTAQTAVASVIDVMNNTSLSNTNGGPVLTKTPLTWTSSQPGAITTATGCTLSCALTLVGPGAATITASCSPPSCNVGFPVVPASLSNSTQISTCTTYFQAIYPKFGGCQLLIPTPVYASNEFVVPGFQPLSPMGAISGLVTGTPTSPTVFAGSTDCAQVSPVNCSSSVYYFATTRASAGSENPAPAPPNSFLFDPTGTKVYMGSTFGAEVVTPGSFGTNTSAFGTLGNVTGKVLAVSASGNSAAFSDINHSPNQVYITSSISTSGPAALSIPNATAAAFSPDGLKTLIIGGTGSSSLYVYSPLQALQGPTALVAPANAITISPNGAFAFVAESATSTSPANITAFSTCNNSEVGTIPLTSNPILMRVLPNLHLDGQDSAGNSIPDGIHLAVLDSTGLDIITATISLPATTPTTLCQQILTLTDAQHPMRRIELGSTINQQNGISFFLRMPLKSTSSIQEAPASSLTASSLDHSSVGLNWRTTHFQSVLISHQTAARLKLSAATACSTTSALSREAPISRRSLSPISRTTSTHSVPTPQAPAPAF